MAFLDRTGLERLWLHIVTKLGGKVDKEDGKGLSTNDYTTEEKEKLARLQETVQIDIDNALNSTSENPVQNKVINSAIEARVNKAGDTMTGDLTISAMMPSLGLYNNGTSTHRGLIFANSSDNSIVIDSRDTSVNNASRRLAISNATGQASKDKALRLIDINEEGYGAYYRVFHTGMETPIPIANGGTGATSAPNALTSLGAVAKSGDTMGGKLVANATSVATLGTAQVRNIWAGTADISEVENSLNEGDIYLQYEEV